jgi:hypothetical protein
MSGISMRIPAPGCEHRAPNPRVYPLLSAQGSQGPVDSAHAGIPPDRSNRGDDHEQTLPEPDLPIL